MQIREARLLLQPGPSPGVEDVGSAWRSRARACHPDRNPDDDSALERMVQLNLARDCLLQALSRGELDALEQAEVDALEALDGRAVRFQMPGGPGLEGVFGAALPASARIRGLRSVRVKQTVTARVVVRIICLF